MRVLLAYPFRENTYQKIGFILPPMGIGYIASTLRDAGHAVDVVDFNIKKNEKIDFDKYDVVGISMDTNRFKNGISIAREAKAKGCIVVAGGPHVSFMDEDALTTCACDYVVRGEGEHSVVELLSAIEKGDVLNVKGISYMNNGKLVRTGDRGFINDIDDLIPARDLLNLQSYRNIEMGEEKNNADTYKQGVSIWL